jgi:hypothetical protein
VSGSQRFCVYKYNGESRYSQMLAGLCHCLHCVWEGIKRERKRNEMKKSQKTDQQQLPDPALGCFAL